MTAESASVRAIVLPRAGGPGKTARARYGRRAPSAARNACVREVTASSAPSSSEPSRRSWLRAQLRGEPAAVEHGVDLTQLADLVPRGGQQLGLRRAHQLGSEAGGGARGRAEVDRPLPAAAGRDLEPARRPAAVQRWADHRVVALGDVTVVAAGGRVRAAGRLVQRLRQLTVEPGRRVGAEAGRHGIGVDERALDLEPQAAAARERREQLTAVPRPPGGSRSGRPRCRAPAAGTGPRSRPARDWWRTSTCSRAAARAGRSARPPRRGGPRCARPAGGPAPRLRRWRTPGRARRGSGGPGCRRRGHTRRATTAPEPASTSAATASAATADDTWAQA